MRTALFRKLVESPLWIASLALLAWVWVIPMEVDSEIGVRRFDVRRLDLISATIVCRSGGLFQKRFVEKQGRPRYVPVHIGRAELIVRDDGRFGILLCAA